MLHSIEYLVNNEATFRLYYNFARQTQPSLRIRSSRHAQHQVAHLVFLTLQSKTDMVDLDLMFRSFMYQNGFITSAIHTDLIQLIPDESTLKEPGSVVLQ